MLQRVIRGLYAGSWNPGQKRTRTWFLKTFLMITQNLNIRLANPVNAEQKYVVRTCHLKDFEICRQDFEKRWGTGWGIFLASNLWRNMTTRIFNQTYNINPPSEPRRQGEFIIQKLLSNIAVNDRKTQLKVKICQHF